MKSNTFGDFARSEASIFFGIPDRWRSYDCCVMVELLPLDLSDIPVEPDTTDSSEGLILKPFSARLCAAPVLCSEGLRAG